MKIKKNSFFILFLLFTFSLSIKLYDKKHKNKQNINSEQEKNIQKINKQQEKNNSYYTGLLVIRILILVSGISILSYYVIKQFFWPNNDEDNDEYEILINNEKEIKKKIYLLKNDLKPIEFSNVNNNMNYSENCPICLDDFQSNSKIVLTPCHHIFHYKCFKEFFMRKNGNLCALCKYNFMSLLEGKNINLDNVDINLNDEEILNNNNLINNSNNNNENNNNNNNDILIENDNENDNLLNNNINNNNKDSEIILNEENK